MGAIGHGSSTGQTESDEISTSKLALPLAIDKYVKAVPVVGKARKRYF